VQKKSKSKVPSIVHHKARNADVVFLRCADGKRRQIYLGPHGSEQARQRYHEVIASHLDGEEPEPAKRSSQPKQAPSV
jgi:ribosomal protein L2